MKQVSGDIKKRNSTIFSEKNFHFSTIHIVWKIAAEHKYPETKFNDVFP